MNMNTAMQEGLNVVKGPFEMPEGRGTCFPQVDGTVTGEARLEGRLYEMEADLKGHDVILTMYPMGGKESVVVECKFNPNFLHNDRAPRWQTERVVEIGEYEYRVAVWFSYTRHESRYLSIAFTKVEEVDDSLMDKFENALPQKKQSFLDTVDSDTRESVRDTDEELEPDLLSGPRREDDPFQD